MTPKVKFILVLLSVMGFATASYAQYTAKVIVNSGNSFVVKKLNVQGGRLHSDSGRASTPLSMVKKIEFRFSGIGLKMCETMFRSGDRKALEGLLDQYLAPVVSFSHLPTNLGDYLVWQLRAQYWNGNPTGAAKTIGYIHQTKNPVRGDFASLYYVMMLLDQDKLTNAKTVFSSVGSPEDISAPMAEYIRGKIALGEGAPRQAMQHVAQIIAFHSRDPEWMAPATALEARIYQRLGQPQKAAAVANELIIAYPGTQWSKQGEKIKMESTGT